jgi:hypothetical protein
MADQVRPHPESPEWHFSAPFGDRENTGHNASLGAKMTNHSPLANEILGYPQVAREPIA